MVIEGRKEEWSYVSMDDGAQYVMTHGTIMMLKWFADNLAMGEMVNLCMFLYGNI